MMTIDPHPTTHDVVFLLDVDNTLLDNDRIIADLRHHLETRVRHRSADRYWVDFEALRSELGYADYLGALQRYRVDVERARAGASTLLAMSSFLIDYPFADRLYPDALEVVAHLGRIGRTVILSDGDVVFQPRKVERSGLWRAVDGRVLIYVHKEQMLDGVAAPIPGEPLRDGRRQAAHPGGDEGGLGRPPGRRSSCARATTPTTPPTSAAIRPPTAPSSASATYSPSRSAPCSVATLRTSHERLHREVARSRAKPVVDNMTHDRLADGTPARYIADFSIAGLTSKKATIFEKDDRRQHHLRRERAAARPGQLDQRPHPPLSAGCATARPPDTPTMATRIDPLAGTPAPESALVDVYRLVGRITGAVDAGRFVYSQVRN